MSGSKDLAEEKQNMENERLDNEYHSKVSGLHSKTRFYDYQQGMFKVEYHEHPETHELVIIRTWAVANGLDDVDYEFELEGVYPPIACELAKLNAPYMVQGKHFRFKK